MKLYINDLSPFANRVRLAVKAKSLPVEIVYPPESGTKGPEYLAINPMGRVPALVRDDGSTLPESETILEYLADKFPQAGLRANTPELIAHGRLLSRLADLYVISVGQKLFGQMNPQTRDAAAVDAAFAELHAGLTNLDTFLTDDRYAAGDTLTIADCTLVPILVFADLFGQLFGREPPTSTLTKLGAYWSRVQCDPAVAEAVTHMRAALKKALGV